MNPFALFCEVAHITDEPGLATASLTHDHHRNATPVVQNKNLMANLYFCSLKDVWPLMAPHENNVSYFRRWKFREKFERPLEIILMALIFMAI